MAGRPTKYTPELASRIVETVRGGNTFRDAALSAGISEDTLARWRERYADFAEGLARAEAEATLLHVETITKAARLEGDWRASAWWLERRRHEDWRKRDETQVNGPDGGPVRFTLRIDRGDGDGSDAG